MSHKQETDDASSAFQGLGKALRWLREKQLKKQYQVADAAGITKAMLSAYETGKQRPTLDTLEKILDALGVDLGDLFDTLQVVNERPAEMRYRDPERPAESDSAPRAAESGVQVDIRAILGEMSLDPEEEAALVEMVRGYYRWLRVLRRQVFH